jgi:hypothetical protein
MLHLNCLVSKIRNRQKTEDYSPNFLFYCDSQTKYKGNPLSRSALKHRETAVFHHDYSLDTISKEAIQLAGHKTLCFGAVIY